MKKTREKGRGGGGRKEENSKTVKRGQIEQNGRGTCKNIDMENHNLFRIRWSASKQKQKSA